jgi:hypothetical protein
MNQGYRVIVDDNYHYMDKDERSVLGEYATYAEALAASRKLVEDFFADSESGTTHAEAYEAYTMMGDDPWIEAFGGAPAPKTRFSAWGHAKEHSKQLFGQCGGAQ